MIGDFRAYPCRNNKQLVKSPHLMTGESVNTITTPQHDAGELELVPLASLTTSALTISR